MKLTSLHTKNFPARIAQIDRVMQKIQSGRMTIVDWPDAPYYAKYIEQALTELGVTKEEWEVYKNAGQNHNTPELASIIYENSL